MKCVYFNQTNILGSHKHTYTPTKSWTTWIVSFHSFMLNYFLFVNASWGPSCTVFLHSRPWSMSSVTSDILEKYLILGFVMWNNGCISQGRLTAVTNIPKSPWLSPATLSFSFTSQTEDRAWKILWASPGNGIAPSGPRYGLWLHLNERGLVPASTVARKKGRHKAIGEHQLSQPVWNFHGRVVPLSTSRDIQIAPWKKGL